MKLKKALIITLITLLLISPFTLTTKIKAQQNYQKNELLVSKILEDFETNDKDWKAEGSKYTSKGYPIVKPKVESWPEALFGRKGDPNNKYCLGVKTSYYKMGYNELKIFPKENIKVPGIAKVFYIWVWGANFAYDMEMQLKDYKGITHTLAIARLSYLGWKCHKVVVPDYIPQLKPTLPRIQNLLFERFTIWSLPGSQLEGFNVFLDHFTVLTDVAYETFDGDDLNNPDIWNTNQ